ncbi:MAG: dihydrolipoamide acetyltransferase family protein, partial [bacterium]|nr:dihydrolipoamide acetyltransferase family protein [bacterium]
MKIDMVMPQMGESITEATIIKWLKQPGEKVQKDEVILEISTDKVDSEIPSPATGILAEVLFKEQDVVPVKQKIAVIDTEASAGASVSAPVKEAAKPVAPPRMEVLTPPASVSATPQTNGNGHQSSDKFYSPLVKTLADKHGISLAELDAVHGSGAGGRITKEDFNLYLDSRGASSAASMSTAGSISGSVPMHSAPTQSYQAPEAVRSAPAPRIEVRQDSSASNTDGNKIVVMDNMRQAIAEHMVMSKRTSPHVYSVQEVDVTNISKWRSAKQKEFLDKEGVKLSFTPFFLEAAVRGLVKFPEINASVDGKKIILKKNINLGCAVALPNKGLIVPVIKRAEEKNLVGIARSLNELADKARNKKLSPDDVQGGTFTVTNPGVFGTIIGYPIINQPQVAILSLGAIKKRPVVIDDMIAIRDVCYLTLSYDHRIVDGGL